MNENEISQLVIGLCIKVHKKLGPGLLESSYEECLFYELSKNNLKFSRQQTIPIIYDEIKLDHGFRADIIIENKVIVEIKSIETFQPVHSAQLLTYLRLTDIKLGLLINFNTYLIKEGIKRIVNNL